MTISPPESGEKNKKILESPVKADPKPIDFAKLDKPIAMPFKLKFNFWYNEIISCECIEKNF